MSVNPGNQAGKKPLSRKPSFKNRKPPEIKHTLTSKYRMLKANPLLMSELERQVLSSNATGDRDALILDKPLKTLAPFFDANSTRTTFDFSSKDKVEKPPRKVEIYSRPKGSFNVTSSVSKIDFGSSRVLSSTIIENNRRESTKKQTLVVKKNENNRATMRRSRSAENVDKKRMTMSTLPTPIKSAKSVERLPQISQNYVKLNNHSIIVEENSLDRTPKASSSKTPSGNNRRSLFLNTPTAEHLLDKLNSWLKRRGKNLGEYHHLKCFGAHNKKEKRPVDEENKENEESNIEKSNSYKDLSIIDDIEKPPEDVPRLNLESIAREALEDLHKLILQGYPSEQCEIWLNVIKNKYKQLEEEPLYWECRAALEQAKGDINSAVECYKTAIIQGAEVAVVDKSLDQLLQKFSLLNIDQEDSRETDTGRSKVIEDARNIFKSSIIKFAVQERVLKKKSNDRTVLEKKLYATPVRRSTRLSRSKYVSTPGIKLYSTFYEAENDTNDEIKFKTNKALKS